MYWRINIRELSLVRFSDELGIFTIAFEKRYGRVMVRNFLISILEWAVRDLQIITESVLLNCDLHTLKYLEDKVQIWEQYEMRANDKRSIYAKTFFLWPKTVESFLHRFVRLVFEVNGMKSVLLRPKTGFVFTFVR